MVVAGGSSTSVVELDAIVYVSVVFQRAFGNSSVGPKDP